MRLIKAQLKVLLGRWGSNLILWGVYVCVCVCGEGRGGGIRYFLEQHNAFFSLLVKEYDSCPLQLKGQGFKEAHPRWNCFWMGDN